MSDYVYFPVVKTRDAELRCFKNLAETVFSSVLPIYELTKSRKTKVAPDGDIHRRMKEIKGIQGDNPFILDLCTDERYCNPQIEQLLSEDNGFYEWKVFVTELYSDLNIIPTVHLYEDDDGVVNDVKRFVGDISRSCNNVAVRLPYDLAPEEMEAYLTPIYENLNGNCKVFVLLDSGHIREEVTYDPVILTNTFIEASRLVAGLLKGKLEDVVMVCGSFPSIPKNEGQKVAVKKADADFLGSYRIYEEELFNLVRIESPIKCGDYASINVEQIEVRGRGFVPRVDIVTEDAQTFIYRRYRQKDGGYYRCAKEISVEPEYKDLNSWADREIALAASDKASGISPSYWISVRMAYYIQTKINLRLND